MKEYLAGIDVGGTTVKIGLFPRGEKASVKWEITTRKFAEIGLLWRDIADSINDKLKELGLEKGTLKAAGVGIPGPVREDGFLTKCVNLGLSNCYPAELLSEALGGIPVAVGNDANVAALGEASFGAAKDVKNSLMITLGTGVGAGVIINGKIVAGNRGLGGEIGHFTVNPDETVKCNCGSRGCLEQYASATGMVRIAKKLLAETDMISGLRRFEDFEAKDVCDEAKKGDELALQTLEVLGKYLGIALSHAILLVDPDVIVIGGGVSKAGKILTDTVEKYLNEYIHVAESRAELRLAELGNDGGIYGAAALAEELL